MLLSLPSSGTDHNGGAIEIGPDGYIYVAIGDILRNSTMTQNVPDGLPPNGTGGILRISQEGAPSGVFNETQYNKLNLYYAYGIRNSFGMDFDPITGYLWDSENGPTFGDEINLVRPRFNSGWSQLQGFWRAD